MLLDQYGRPLNTKPSLVDFLYMEALLKAATKELIFVPTKAQRVRQIAKECARESLPEDEQATISFGLSYG